MADHVTALGSVVEDITLPLVSVIIPLHNAATTLDRTLASAIAQDYIGPVEISVYDDCSSDDSGSILANWCKSLRDDSGGGVVGPARSILITRGSDIGAGTPHGPAFARNRAVEASSGQFVCLMDADDEAAPDRVRRQLELCRAGENVLVGGGFVREPAGSTAAYTTWANSLSREDLYTQQWKECTVIQPTWFMRRSTFELIGGYDELPPRCAMTTAASVTTSAAGCTVPASHISSNVASEVLDVDCGLLSRPPTRIDRSNLASHTLHIPFPEDTIFLHRHLHAGGQLDRVMHSILTYRYSAGSETWKMPRQQLLRVRVALFEERVLQLPTRAASVNAGAGAGGQSESEHESGITPPSASSTLIEGSASSGGVVHWDTFSIWGAGRDGKAFYNALSPAGKARVIAFCDIDPKKIGQVYPLPVRPLKPAKVAKDGAKRALALGVSPGLRSPEDVCGVHSASASGCGNETVADSCVDERDSMLALPPPSKRRMVADDAGSVGSVAMGHAVPGASPGTRSSAPPASNAALLAPAINKPVPIVHFSACTLPIVCCVATGMAGEELYANVATLTGVEVGRNFWYFV